MALTLPPLAFWPALFAYSALPALLAGAATRHRPHLARFLTGAAFGLGYHLAGLWWIGSAFLVDAEAFAAFLPLAVLGLPLLLAPFHGLATLFAGLARGPAIGLVALAAAIGASEWLRSVVLTGFPWNVPAAQLSGLEPLLQGAALVGVEGLAPLAVLTGLIPAALGMRGARPVAAIALAFDVALGLYGAVRLSAPVATAGPPVRIVQPSVPQAEKWTAEHQRRNWDRLLSLTAAPGAPARIIWPETAIPFVYREAGAGQRELAAVVPAGTVVVAGTVELEDGPAGTRVATNSVRVIDDSGRLTARYDKVRLVPFGEFLPFGSVLNRLGLTALTQATSQFRAGPAPSLIDAGGMPLLPRICYESIFPVPAVAADARAVVNVTNDAWFGDTPGPRQHLLLTRLRAIESGLPVIRAANNGISAMIDARGRLQGRLPLDRVGVLDAPLPPKRATLWQRWGMLPFSLFLVVTGVAAAVPRRQFTTRCNR